MAGRKRSRTDDAPATEKRETRSSKVQKTEGGRASGRGGAKGAARLKTGLTASAFKSRAAPIHLALSFNPFPGEGHETVAVGEGEEQASILTTTTLTASSFSTGSFGWKGSKRIAIPLKAPGEGGEAEEDTVHIMLTVNATVIGSKDVKESAEEREEAKEEGEGTKESAEEGEGIKEGGGEDEGAQEEQTSTEAKAEGAKAAAELGLPAAEATGNPVTVAQA